MNWIRILAITILVVSASVGPSSAATVPGMVDDGMTSVYYISATGELGIQPDGRSVGHFEILSASGIFNGNATLPSAGLGINVNTASQISWLVRSENAVHENFSLGNVAGAALQLDFLLNDLTFYASGGFGTIPLDVDLVYTIPEVRTATLSGLALLSLVGRRFLQS
jgi:hypothetical protein